MIDGLVYDVGMNDGTDSEYYLRLGMRVVAFEADPTLCELASARLARHGDHLTIVNVAIADHEGHADFWISPANRVFSSFDRGLASRGGVTTAVRVPCRPFASILREFGVPAYLMIDIEGFDDHCLTAVSPTDRPRFLSLELSEGDQISRVQALGYNAFKIIEQSTFTPLLADGPLPGGVRPGAAAHSPVVSWLRARPASLGRKLRRAVLGRDRAKVVFERSLPDGSRFGFRHGSSGPFGDDAPGPWVSADDARHAWARFASTRHEPGDPWRGKWFDLHATTR